MALSVGGCSFWMPDLIGHGDPSPQPSEKKRTPPLMSQRVLAGENVMSDSFVSGLCMGHRADDGHLVGKLSSFLHQLNKLHILDFGFDGSERPAGWSRAKGLGSSDS